MFPDIRDSAGSCSVVTQCISSLPCLAPSEGFSASSTDTTLRGKETLPAAGPLRKQGSHSWPEPSNTMQIAPLPPLPLSSLCPQVHRHKCHEISGLLLSHLRTGPRSTHFHHHSRWPSTVGKGPCKLELKGSPLLPLFLTTSSSSRYSSTMPSYSAFSLS